MATCSLPSLQWIPSSDDIVCVQPALGIHYNYLMRVNSHCFAYKALLLNDECKFHS